MTNEHPQFRSILVKESNAYQQLPGSCEFGAAVPVVLQSRHLVSVKALRTLARTVSAAFLAAVFSEIILGINCHSASTVRYHRGAVHYISLHDITLLGIILHNVTLPNIT